MHKLHHSLNLHFLITGHTKFAPEWCFGLIKQRFRKTRVNTLYEIAGVVKDSTVTGVNIPQLVGLEDGTVLVESYGWQQHLTQYFRPLPQIKQYQHFCFNALEPGVDVAKERSDSAGTRFQMLRNADVLPPINGLPVQAPPGLDTTRQTYLFEKIREFYDEEGMDITCPAPKSRAGQNQALRIQIPLFMRGLDRPVHHWGRVPSHPDYLQYLYAHSHDSLLIFSCSSATLPLIVCI